MTKGKEYTESQSKFLEALFGEAKGDVLLAKKLAGYADSTRTMDIVKALREEIIEQAHLALALNSPRAAMELVGLMIDPSQASGTTKLKAVEQILNRVGVSSTDKSEVNLKVPQGGLFIMPAKGAQPDGENPEPNPTES